MTNNIKYDVEAYFAEKEKHQSAPDVLRRRLAVSAGYAKIFKALCDIAEVYCIVIHGFTKAYSYRRGDPYPKKSTHAWNLVHLDGGFNAMYLIDSCWGAGYVGEDDRFKKEHSDFWWLTDPEQFIMYHYTENAPDQLLNKYTTREKYWDKQPLINRI